jgi:diaminopimelate epimerase
LIPFTKAHACGNDFLIMAQEAVAEQDWPRLTRHLCSRNTSIGADGIEFFQWTGPKSGRIRLHNADGSIAEISGNGTRCVAAWIAEKLGAQPGDEFEIETDAGLRSCHINAVSTADGYTVEVTTGMGVPSFASRTVTLPTKELGGRAMQIAGIEVSTGNPHFVIVVDNADFAIAGHAWEKIGTEICTHPDFPHQTNVEFVHVISPTQIEIRIFERGVGPTTSSGTGTSASATAAIAFHGCISPLSVIAPGGPQTIAWSGPGTELQLTGPASLIARGEAWFA